MAEDTGFTCYRIDQSTASLCNVTTYQTHILLSNKYLYRATFWDDLRNIAKFHCLLGALIGMNAQVLYDLWVETSTSSKLRKVILELLQRICNIGLEGCEVEGIITRSSLITPLGRSLLLFFPSFCRLVLALG